MYYLQIYAFYDEVSAEATDLRLTPMVTGAAEPILADAVEAIDADSSPLRFRACFTVPMSQAMLTETYAPYDRPEPLNAPPWFDCFDAARIGADLASGEALAFLGEKNIAYGVDRVVAIYGDGRAYAWHQLNNCGETAYDGSPVGEECPPREE
ncbi:histidine kinase [Rhodobacteraceae bacterium CCMM004]|nr:histidine kinase [Rhodobacteraceae bacterium CCMM004]